MTVNLQCHHFSLSTGTDFDVLVTLVPYLLLRLRVITCFDGEQALLPWELCKLATSMELSLIARENRSRLARQRGIPYSSLS